MIGSIFKLSQCRFVWVPFLQISPACYADLFYNRCDSRSKSTGLFHSFFNHANALAVSVFCSIQ